MVKLQADKGRIDRQPSFLIRRSEQILATLFLEECATFSLKISQLQLAALCAIQLDPGLKQISLAKGLGIDRSSATVLVDKLSKLELVIRAPSKSRRENSLELTKNALEVLESRFVASKNSAATFLKPLSTADKKRLIKLLSQMAHLHHLPASEWAPLKVDNSSPVSKSSQAKLHELYALPDFLLGRCTQISYACLLEVTKPYGLSSGQAGTLFVIALLGPIDQGALRRSVGADRSSVSVIIPTLVEKGLVIKEKDLLDRRRTLVSCTPAGLDLIERAQPDVAVAGKRCFEGLAADTEEKLCGLLTRLIAAHDDFY